MIGVLDNLPRIEVEFKKLIIYDETYGDEQNWVKSGSSFESLAYYSCPVCESGKDELNMVIMVMAGPV